MSAKVGSASSATTLIVSSFPSPVTLTMLVLGLSRPLPLRGPSSLQRLGESSGCANQQFGSVCPVSLQCEHWVFLIVPWLGSVGFSSSPPPEPPLGRKELGWVFPLLFLAYFLGCSVFSRMVPFWHVSSMSRSRYIVKCPYMLSSIPTVYFRKVSRPSSVIASTKARRLKSVV